MININKCSGLSRDWVGAKIMFMCFFSRVIPYGGEKTHKQSPPKNPGTIPWKFCLHQEWPRQTKPKKVSSWTFRRGIPEQKFNVNRACFPKEKRQNSQKWAKFMNFSFWPFLLFGLAGWLLTKIPGQSRENFVYMFFSLCVFFCSLHRLFSLIEIVSESFGHFQDPGPRGGPTTSLTLWGVRRPKGPGLQACKFVNPGASIPLVEGLPY